MLTSRECPNYLVRDIAMLWLWLGLQQCESLMSMSLIDLADIHEDLGVWVDAFDMASKSFIYWNIESMQPMWPVSRARENERQTFKYPTWYWVGHERKRARRKSDQTKHYEDLWYFQFQFFSNHTIRCNHSGSRGYVPGGTIPMCGCPNSAGTAKSAPV